MTATSSDPLAPFDDATLRRIAAAAPYRPYPAAGDPAWARRDAGSVAALLAEAERALALPWPELDASRWLEFWRTGSRTEFEGPYFERRRRLALWTLSTAVRADHRDGEQALESALGSVLSEPTWCVPAHHRRPGAEPSPEVNPALPVLDLFAAETGALIAWLLSIRPAGPLVDDAAAQVRLRVLDAFRRDARDSFWYGISGNWNPWIVSNVIACALLLPDVDGRAEILALAVDSLRGYAAAVPSDGGCPEGILYWWQSGARLFEAVEMLGRGDADAAAAVFAHPLLARIARYPAVVSLGDAGWSAVFADGRARTLARGGGSLDERNSPELLFRFGRATGAREAIEHAVRMRGDGPAVALPLPLGRALPAFFDESWPDAQPTASERIDGARWLARTEIFSVDGGGGTRLVAKGGHNDEPHNHLDVGSYVVGVRGVPVIVDPGSGLYTAASFGPRRYEQWFTRTAFHSAPLPTGRDQGVGAGFRATPTSVDPQAGTLELDLTAAYPAAAGVTSWRRMFAPAADGFVVVDEVAGAATTDPDTRIVVMLAAAPARESEGCWALRGPDDPATIAFLEIEGAAAVCEELPLTDPVLRAVWGERLVRLLLHPTTARVVTRVRSASV